MISLIFSYLKKKLLHNNSKPFYKRIGFWIKLILIGGACFAPFFSDTIKKIVVLFIVGA